MKILLFKYQMEMLPTPRLLAYLDSLRRWHEGPDWDSLSVAGTKQDPEWQRAYRDAKEVLSKRPHLD